MLAFLLSPEEMVLLEQATPLVAWLEREAEEQGWEPQCSCRAEIARWSIALLPTIPHRAGWEETATTTTKEVLGKGLPVEFLHPEARFHF